MDGVDGGGDVGGELLGGEVVDEAVPVSVRGDLVTGFGDPADEARVPLSDPAEDEERRPDFALVKEREQTVGVGFHAALVLVPIVSRYAVLERGYLVVVFDVNGQCVADRVAGEHVLRGQIAGIRVECQGEWGSGGVVLFLR